MAPQPAPSGAPGAGVGKRLPPWAWLLAAGAGILVGVFLLRRTGGTGADEDQTAGTGSDRKPSGAVVEPLTEDMLQALGVQDGGWQAPRYSSSESGNGGGTGGGEAGASGSGSEAESGIFHPVSSGLSYLSGPTSPTPSGQSYFSGPSSPTPSGQSFGGSTSPVSSGITYTPTAPSGGGKYVPQ